MSNKGVVGEILKNSDHEFEWIIGDIFSYITTDEYYWSPRFDVSGYKWRLLICPNGISKFNSVGWITLFLFSEEGSVNPITAHFSFGVKREEADGTTIVERRCDLNWVFEKYNPILGYGQILEKMELLGRRSELAPSDALTLTCTLRVNENLHSSARLDTLSENLTDMLTSMRDCDVTLRVGQVDFSAHKFVLSARSPVLAAMLKAEMRKKDTGVILYIPDCKPEPFWEFLQYLYSGKTKNLSGNLFDLYRIADKYDVKELKSDCVVSIMGSLSVANVLDAVIFADQFHEKGVKIKSQDFFNHNFVSKIVETEKWESFMRENCRLANALLKDMRHSIKVQRLVPCITTNW